jgi:putative phosphoesterase
MRRRFEIEIPSAIVALEARGRSPVMGNIGVISDTHGLLRPQAVAALQGSALIIHAGDVGRPEILEELRRIAPVVAVRGNVDSGAWAMSLPQSEMVEHDGIRLYVIHILEDLDLDPPTAGFHAVITGHTHRPKMESKDGVLYFNPGSAGPRRFDLPVSVGRLLVADGKLRGEIITLTV